MLCDLRLRHTSQESEDEYTTYTMNKKDGSHRVDAIWRFGKNIRVSSTIDIGRLILDSRVLYGKFINHFDLVLKVNTGGEFKMKESSMNE